MNARTSLFKELREAVLPFAILLLVAYRAVESVLADGASLVGSVLTWNTPETRTALFAVLGFAFWQFAGERLRGTHAYLVLRGVSRANLFAAKAVVGLVSIAAAFGASFVFHLIVLQSSPLVGLFDRAALVDVFALGVCVVPIYAIGALLAVGWEVGSTALLGRFALAALASGGLLTGVPRLLGPLLGTPRQVLQVSLFALAFAVALWLAYARFVTSADGDLAERPARVRVRAAFLVLLVFGQLVPLVDRWQHVLSPLEIPLGVMHADGRFAELVRNPHGAGYVGMGPDGLILAEFPDQKPGAAPDPGEPFEGWAMIPQQRHRWFSAADPRRTILADGTDRSRYSSRAEVVLGRSLCAAGDGALEVEVIYQRPGGKLIARYWPSANSPNETHPSVNLDPERAHRQALERPPLSDLARTVRTEGDEDRRLPGVHDPESGETFGLVIAPAGLETLEVSESDAASKAVKPTGYPRLALQRSQWALFGAPGEIVEGWRAPREFDARRAGKRLNFAMVTVLQPTALTLLGSLQQNGVADIDRPIVSPDEPYRSPRDGRLLEAHLAGFGRPWISIGVLGLGLLATLGVARRERGTARRFWVPFVAVSGLVGWVGWWFATGPERREAAAQRGIDAQVAPRPEVPSAPPEEAEPASVA